MISAHPPAVNLNTGMVPPWRRRCALLVVLLLGLHQRPFSVLEAKDVRGTHDECPGRQGAPQGLPDNEFTRWGIGIPEKPGTQHDEPCNILQVFKLPFVPAVWSRPRLSRIFEVSVRPELVDALGH